MAIIPGTAKVLNQYENVNTTYGGSKAMKAQSKWYTMDDVIETINANQPYKVFTALVSQSGSDNPSTAGAESPMTLGITYLIDDNSNDFDFTVFGAPNSNIGTSFICTTAGTLPNDPGILLIYNTATPVATILENTIGNIVFGYIESGRYSILSDSLFALNKVFINGASLVNALTVNAFVDSSGASNDNGYFFNQVDATSIILNGKKGAGIGDNVIQNPICIEIRVYN